MEALSLEELLRLCEEGDEAACRVLYDMEVGGSELRGGDSEG